MCEKFSWFTGQAAPDVKGAVRGVWLKFQFLHIAGICFLHLWGRNLQLQLFKPILYLFFASNQLCDKHEGCDQSAALSSQLSLCMTCSPINQQSERSWTWNNIRLQKQLQNNDDARASPQTRCQQMCHSNKRRHPCFNYKLPLGGAAVLDPPASHGSIVCLLLNNA